MVMEFLPLIEDTLLPGQRHRHRLVVRLDDHAHRSAPIESVKGNREADHHRALNFLAGLQFVLRRECGQRVLFQRGKSSKVAIEINGGNGLAARFSAGRHHLAVNVVNPQ